MSSAIMIQVAPGELLDKLSILQIKLERIADAAKLANVHAEFQVLDTARKEDIQPSAEIDALYASLKVVNERLWVIEDDIRDEERAKRFGERFIELARSVYVVNDERAEIKRKINTLLDSPIIEEKSYADYR